jgi:hypothetical protein
MYQDPFKPREDGTYSHLRGGHNHNDRCIYCESKDDESRYCLERTHAELRVQALRDEKARLARQAMLKLTKEEFEAVCWAVRGTGSGDAGWRGE